MLEKINKYLENGWVLIPIATRSKKPLVSWQQYQTTKPTDAEYEKWFSYEHNVAVITGKLSGITVIDIDKKENCKELLEKLPKKGVNIVSTPRGGYHYYFAYTPELKTTTKPDLGVDVRNDGGYVLIPPSETDLGKYKWLKFSKKLVPVPKDVIAFLSPEKKTKFSKDNLVQGGRDEGLFHLALTLAKGGMRYDEIYEALKPYADMCKPPFPDDELRTKINSALKRVGEKSSSLVDDVREYIENVSGIFSFRNICQDLNIYSVQDKKNVSKILNDLAEEGVLVRTGKWNATYRKKDTGIQPIDVEKLKTSKPLGLRFPFELEKKFLTYPKNIIVIAGSQNIGKTLFALNFAKMNQDKFKIHYFNSEMSEEELAIRLNQFKTKWKTNFYCRTNNFADVIQPDDVNIIDYLEISDEFWKIGAEISKLHEKLGKGVCLLCLQKDSRNLLGRGASFGLEKPRAYISMDKDRIIIVKAKNWADPSYNPNFKCVDYKIKGTEFMPAGDWYDYKPPVDNFKKG